MATKNPSKSGNPAKRGTASRPPVQPATARDWVHAARLRTLPMAIAPVAVGTAAAYSLAGYHLGIALLCLALALLLQIGVNFANDYADGVRGTDRDRVGPSRLTGSGKASPTTVRTVALVFLGLGALAGLALTIVSGRWWLLAVGVVCLLAAWFYTGGKRPYGYFGLGEVVAFVCFGLIATLGTTYAMLGRWSEDALVLACAVGCFAAAALLVNNIRDIHTDRSSGKRTLTTFIGLVPSKLLYGVLMLAPLVILGFYAVALAYGIFVLILVALVAVPAVVIVALGREPRDFIVALGLTSLSALAFGVGVAVALWGGLNGFGTVGFQD